MCHRASLEIVQKKNPCHCQEWNPSHFYTCYVRKEVTVGDCLAYQNYVPYFKSVHAYTCIHMSNI